MKFDAIFKKYLTAEHARSQRLFSFFFSAFSRRGVGHRPYGFRLVEPRAYSSERPEAANSAVNYLFLFRLDRPFFWPEAALTPETDRKCDQLRFAAAYSEEIRAILIKSLTSRLPEPTPTPSMSFSASSSATFLILTLPP